jgi:ribosome biogenesis GTPase
MKEGIITKGIGGFYYVDVQGTIIECKARGIFRRDKLIPMVGDRVMISVINEEKCLGVIEEILDRKCKLIRPPVANVNQAVVVFAVAQPEPDLTLLDRFLVLAESQDLDITICLNKVDLAPEEAYKELAETCMAAGYRVILTSKRDHRGIEDLRQALEGKITVFAGPSGVGKSSLLNQIQENIVLKTGEVSIKTERGKHTTRHVELINVEGLGWVVDTPGFSSLSLDFMEVEKLQHYFKEFLPYEEDCKFSSCLHLNEPQCGVKAALEEGLIYLSRYESYRLFVEEIKKNRRY